MNPEEKDPKIRIKSLRTYQGDVDEILSKGKASASTILIAEQKRKEKTLDSLRSPAETKIRNKFFIILGITLFIIGVITLIAVYYVKSTEEVAIIQKTKALIGFSEEKDISLAGVSRDSLLTKIVTEKQSLKITVNSVLYINTVDEQNNPVAVEKVLGLLAPKMPASLSRSFEDKYMLGIYSFNTNEPFIILTTKDYAGSFSGMLKWEKDMPTELGKIFEIPQNTSGETPVFVDEALKNKDLRILKDDNDKTILLYSFIDRNTVVITTNENILTAILGKYLINKTVR